MTPSDLFHRAGLALFGDQYVAPMAVLLGVEKNTVGKWRDGKSRVPAGVWSQLKSALLKRGVEIEGVLLEVGNQGLGMSASDFHLKPQRGFEFSLWFDDRQPIDDVLYKSIERRLDEYKASAGIGGDTTIIRDGWRVFLHFLPNTPKERMDNLHKFFRPMGASVEFIRGPT